MKKMKCSICNSRRSNYNTSTFIYKSDCEKRQQHKLSEFGWKFIFDSQYDEGWKGCNTSNLEYAICENHTPNEINKYLDEMKKLKLLAEMIRQIEMAREI